MNLDWAKNLSVAVTVCNNNGIIIYMNDKAAKSFEEEGGYKLIGTSLFDCHSEVSNKIISELLREGKSNSYTIEKKGVKKMIYQTPWYENETVMGLVEIVFEIPFDMRHHIRS
jgi:transcriptional regulator with PAS, ATPase and Fis domain